jgi:hypothetical protein
MAFFSSSFFFFFFTKSENRRVEQVLSGGWYQWKEGEVWEGEFGANTVNTCMKMEK